MLTIPHDISAEAGRKRMAKVYFSTGGPEPIKKYFESVDARLKEINCSRLTLARQIDMGGPQLNRYFTDPDPNPTAKTLCLIEEGIVVLRRRKGQER